MEEGNKSTSVGLFLLLQAHSQRSGNYVLNIPRCLSAYIRVTGNCHEWRRRWRRERGGEGLGELRGSRPACRLNLVEHGEWTCSSSFSHPRLGPARPIQLQSVCFRGSTKKGLCVLRAVDGWVCTSWQSIGCWLQQGNNCTKVGRLPPIFCLSNRCKIFLSCSEALVQSCTD